MLGSHRKQNWFEGQASQVAAEGIWLCGVDVALGNRSVEPLNLGFHW